VALYGMAYVLIALNAPFRYAFMALENTRPMFVGYLATTILTVGVVYPFISIFGLAGAMVGILLTQMVMLSYFVVAYRKRLFA
jgi:O-antigen/teichoic acid export membrane protein